jgi:hypothetical protein
MSVGVGNQLFMVTASIASILANESLAFQPPIGDGILAVLALNFCGIML